MALDLKTQRVVSLKFIGGSLNLSVWPSARQARGAAVIAAPRQAAPALLRSLAGVTTGAWRSARVVDAASTTQRVALILRKRSDALDMALDAVDAEVVSEN